MRRYKIKEVNKEKLELYFLKKIINYEEIPKEIPNTRTR